MTTRPYELLVRFGNDGKIAGCHVRTITTLNGKDYESDPVPLSTTEHPAFDEFKSAFNAASASEIEQLREDNANLQKRIESLLQAVPFDPRVIDSVAFFNRIPKDRLFELYSHEDANVQGFAQMLTAYRKNDWPIILDDAQLIGALQYLHGINLVTEEEIKILLGDATREEAYSAEEQEPDAQS